MTLSICIPIFNRDIGLLLDDIHAQDRAELLEVLLMDDGSDPAWDKLNSAYAHRPKLRYLRQGKNMGRSKVRNALAQEAKGEYLLYLDNDLRLLPNFLDSYCQQLGKADVLAGGLTYPKSAKPAFQLHWKVARGAECHSAAERNKLPYASFHSSNFAIRRALMLQTPFEDLPQGYGHEDTLFGFRLKEQGVQLLHLDNPVFHEVLDDNRSFLAKQEAALNNLHHLQEREGPEFVQFVTLLRTKTALEHQLGQSTARFLAMLGMGFLRWGLERAYLGLRGMRLYRLFYLLRLEKA